MNRFLALAVAAVLLWACGGSAPTPNLMVASSDVIQFRQMLQDDPLAIKLQTPEGTEVQVGDVIVRDDGVLRGVAKPDSLAGTADVILYFKDFAQSRMNNYWRENPKRELVVVVNGAYHCIVTGESRDADGKIRLKNFAKTRDEVDGMMNKVTISRKKGKTQ